MWGTHPISMLEGFNSYIGYVGNTLCIHARNDQHLYLIMWEHIPQSHQNRPTLTSDHVGTHRTVTLKWILHLYLTMEGTNPTMSERLLDLTPPFGGNLNLENNKLVPEVVKLHSGQCLGQHINYLFVHHNILKLHCSSLHHIPDIVIFDLDLLRLVMEHRVLTQLHTNLVVAIYTSSIQLEIKQIR